MLCGFASLKANRTGTHLMSLLRSPRVCSSEREKVFAGLPMKWMLVVLIGGVAPRLLG